jgi:conjugal transfer pilus assembly protein TraV
MSARMTKTAATIALGMTLCACASSPKYACGVPDGIGCKPVRAVYQASLAGVPAIDAKTKPTAGAPPASKDAVKTAPADTATPGDPLLSRPRHLRVWIARWEDADGDLVGESMLYLRLDCGAWVLSP